MGRGQLFVISGPSGVGKGTVGKRILEETDLEFSVSMTTRAPREGEAEAVSYYFVSHEDFEKIARTGGFLEYATVYGNKYGTPLKQTIEKLEAGKDILLDIDIQGAMSIKKLCPDAIFIFILPPSIEELRNRIAGRGSETEESMQARLSEAMKEIRFVHEYEYYVINDDLEQTVQNVKTIVAAEHLKVNENTSRLIEKYEEETKCFTHPLTK